MKKRIGYINVTPRWSELFLIWQRIVDNAVKVNKPGQMERFWSEVETTFKAADQYNDLVTYLRDDQKWPDDRFAFALKKGRELQEVARNKIHYEEDAV